MRTCTKCGKTKELIDFNKHNKSPDGRRSMCRTCQSEEKKRYLSVCGYRKNNVNPLKRFMTARRKYIKALAQYMHWMNSVEVY